FVALDIDFDEEWHAVPGDECFHAYSLNLLSIRKGESFAETSLIGSQESNPFAVQCVLGGSRGVKPQRIDPIAVTRRHTNNHDWFLDKPVAEKAPLEHLLTVPVRFDGDDSRAHTEKYVCFVALVRADIKKQVACPKCL